jgi:hypothetical protein
MTFAMTSFLTFYETISFYLNVFPDISVLVTGGFQTRPYKKIMHLGNLVT